MISASIVAGIDEIEYLGDARQYPESCFIEKGEHS